ncbi:GTP-binding protein [Microbacterium indicum]|uniref:GTP-binding protein n=1 Tax=Microbacterium indicum TaxID=358100 RepID=UPI0003F93234|nr:GTP-binding protein [Microbacterium indicum]
MTPTNLIAVVGTCAPERAQYAGRLAARTGLAHLPLARLAMSPDPIDEAEALAPWSHEQGGAVAELPPAIAPTAIIGRYARADSPVRLIGLVCVVDAAHLISDLARDDYLTVWGSDGERMHRARALATATQIEYATTVVLANWESLATPDLSTVLAIVSALGPTARIRLDPSPYPAVELATPITQVQDRPGWIGLLNDDHEPHMTDRRVSAFRYEAARPFHPARLEALLDDRVEPGDFGTVLRSAGFCRLATRPGTVAHWEHVGSMLSLPPLSDDGDIGDDEELLAAGQDIAFFGLDLDRPALVRALDAACLTDAEFAAGPDAWRSYEDPFPAWERA